MALKTSTIVAASVGGVAILGVIGGVAWAISTANGDPVDPVDPRRPDGSSTPEDRSKGLAPPPDDSRRGSEGKTEDRSKGLAPPPDDSRRESVPDGKTDYGDLPKPPYERAAEIRAATDAVLRAFGGAGTLQARQLAGDQGPDVSKVTDDAFYSRFPLIGKGLLTKGNKTHEPYIQSWKRMAGDVARMIAAMPTIPRAFADPARQGRFARWALGVIALGPIRDGKTALTLMQGAMSMIATIPAVAKLIKPSVSRTAVLTEVAVRLATKNAKMPPSEAWANWSTASKVLRNYGDPST